jgi:hypothetical protein
MTPLNQPVIGARSSTDVADSLPQDRNPTYTCWIIDRKCRVRIPATMLNSCKTSMFSQRLPHLPEPLVVEREILFTDYVIMVLFFHSVRVLFG